MSYVCVFTRLNEVPSSPVAETAQKQCENAPTEQSQSHSPLPPASPSRQQQQHNNNTDSNIETLREKEAKKPGSSTTQLKFRLMSSSNSTNPTMTLSEIPKSFTIFQAKQLLSYHYQNIKGDQKWFLSGRILQNDSKIKNCKIPDDFIVQVHINNNNV